MKSLWPKEFKELEIKSAKEILEEQSEYLLKLTKNMVCGKIIELDILEAITWNHQTDDFKFSFNLEGNYLTNYMFRVFTFSYNIRLYPLKISLDDNIIKELGLSKNINLKNQEEFENLLSEIFKTTYLIETISAIMSYTKHNMKLSTEIL